MADTTESRVLTESTLIPYIRRQDLMFDADNLRPSRIARIFFDDIVMNGFSQKSNKIILNSKKILTVTPNTGASIFATDVVYQGSSNISPTFSAVVDSWNSSSNTLTIKTMSGNFDPSSNLYTENVGITKSWSSIRKIVNSNTAGVFEQNEGLYAANSNVFIRVVGDSGENILYVNENFITANISALGSNTLPSMLTDYANGHIVFQTATGVPDFTKATFVGKVEYYNSGLVANSFVAITPISGKMNTHASGANSRIWNSSNTSSKPLQATAIKPINLSANGVLISVDDITKRTSLLSHVHNSGLFANLTVDSANLTISSANATIANGNLMYFTAGSGLGQTRRIVAVNGSVVTLNAAISVTPTSNTKYSIGNHIVDDNGTLAGILNIPEEPNFKFKTGERILTITDVSNVLDQDYTMKASARFSAGGLAQTVQEVNMTPIMPPLPDFPASNPVAPPDPTEREQVDISDGSTTSDPASPSSTVNPRPRRIREFPRMRTGDPIAQTFFTPKPKSSKISHGVFVSSVDLFFGAKPSTARGSLQLPVSVKIAQVSNGFLSRKYLASATLKASEVKVSTNPSTSNTDTFTKFSFTDPVFLEPNKEYSLIIISESPEYEVYIAELGGDVLGADPPRRISEQPYAGSFFRSQNATTWTPYQNEDLMFRINKAVFNSSGSAIFNLQDAPLSSASIDELLLNMRKITFPVGSVDFKVKGVYEANSAYDSYNYVTPQQFFRYGDLLDASNKAPTGTSLNARKLVLGNSNSIHILAEFTSTDTDISPVIGKNSLSLITTENDVNNAGLSNTVISITNRGEGYIATAYATDSANAKLWRETYLANNANIGFYPLTISGGQGVGATGFAVANTGGSNTVNYIVVDSGGYGYIESPVANVAVGNAATNVRSTVVVSGETGKSGGNILAKYLTRQITLEDGFESGDIRVFMDTVRQNGTDIHVYYKVLGLEDPDRFSDKSWVLMNKVVDRKSTNSRQVVDLEFRPSLTENKLSYTENGRKYPVGDKFKSFAIKVCLTAVDSTVVPKIINLRIVATPEG